MNYTIDLSITAKEDTGILMGIALNEWVVFSNIAIFMILMLAIHKERSFHFRGLLQFLS
jgi:hypothetical protein